VLNQRKEWSTAGQYTAEVETKPTSLFHSRSIQCSMILENNEIEGYLVGLVIGDGHIEPKTNRIVIASNNEEFIDKISDLLKQLEYSHSIFYDKSATVWKISVNSKKLHEILTTKYCIPAGNKTFTDFTPKLENNQLNFFIAGLFDAEGWFEMDKGKYLRARIKMKNKSVISYLREILNQKGYQPKFHEKEEGSFVVDLNNQSDVKKFFENTNLLTSD